MAAVGWSTNTTALITAKGSVRIAMPGYSKNGHVRSAVSVPDCQLGQMPFAGIVCTVANLASDVGKPVSELARSPAMGRYVILVRRISGNDERVLDVGCYRPGCPE